MQKQQPKYDLHKATGQARVRIDGKSIYLGEYGSEESRRRYDEVVTDYMKGTLNVSFHKLTISPLSIAYSDIYATRFIDILRVAQPILKSPLDPETIESLRRSIHEFTVIAEELQPGETLLEANAGA